MSLYSKLILSFGNRPQASGRSGGAPEQRRDCPRHPRVAISAVGEIAAKELVGAFSAERHRHLLPAHLREEPDGERTGIGAGFVRVVGELLNGVHQLGPGAQVELSVVGAVEVRCLADVAALVEAASLEGYGERFQPRRAGGGGVMQDGRGIDAPAGPNAQRHVRHQVFFHRALQQPIELLLGLFQRGLPAPAGLGSATPVAFGAYLAVLPDQEASGQELHDVAHQRVRRGNPVQAEIAVEPVEIDGAVNPGVNEDGLQLRGEINVVAAAGVVERLDAHAVAGQHQAPPRFRP